MKYMLVMHLNPTRFETLTQDQREEIFRGHAELISALTKSGEMVGTVALADPSQTATVRVRDGQVSADDGPCREAEDFLCGYYIVDCESRERAVELAALIPDARYTAIEVRPLMRESGAES